MDQRPGPRGLYDPRFEHDACGVSFVVDVKDGSDDYAAIIKSVERSAGLPT